jgi:hypothetical protein
MQNVHVVSLIAAVIGCISCQGTRVIVTTNHSLDAAAAERIEIFTDGGDIEVEPGESGWVRVEAAREAPTGAAARALPLELVVSGGVARVAFLAEAGAESAVSFLVSVPAGLAVRATTEGGNIGVRGDDTARPLVAWTAGGDVRVTRHRGELRAFSGGGDMHASGVFAGDNVVETAGGDISVVLDETSSLRVEAHTEGGDVENDFGLPNERSGSGFRGTIGGGEAGILTLYTAGGDLSLYRRK